VYGAALLLVGLCLFLLAINVRELRLMHEQSCVSDAPSSNEPVYQAPAWDGKSDRMENIRQRKPPVVWIYGQKVACLPYI
jgi:hypothetical protein